MSKPHKQKGMTSKGSAASKGAIGIQMDFILLELIALFVGILPCLPGFLSTVGPRLLVPLPVEPTGQIHQMREVVIGCIAWPCRVA